MAQLLAANFAAQRARDAGRQPRHAAHRRQLHPLQRSPRPRIRRRAAPHRPALLHEFRCARIRAARRKSVGRRTVMNRSISMWLLAATATALMSGITTAARTAEKEVVVPVMIVGDSKKAAPMQTAVLAGGCFWGVESVFEH